MLSKFLVLLAVPALAMNDTAASSSSSSDAAGTTGNGTTTTTSGGSSNTTSTSSGNATTTTTSTTATTTLKSNTTAAPSSATTKKPAGGADGEGKTDGKMDGKMGGTFGSGGSSGGNGTNGTAATGGNVKALTMPIVYKATVDEDVVSSAGKATCYTNIALLANTGVAVSVVDSACGNMGACSAANTAKCCFKRDAPMATPTKLTECGTFSTTTYLYGLNSGCTLAARRRAEERRGLAGNSTVDVTIDDKPMVEYNDADSTLDDAMSAGATAFNSMSATELNSKLVQMTKEVTSVISSGGTLMGMDVKQLTGDPAATATTYASVTSAATSATVTGEKGTAGVAVQGGSTSNAVAAAFSGLAFVFALLF